MKKIIIFFIVAGIVLYGAYQALMYYDNNFKYGRMRETPGVRPREMPMPVMSQGLVPVDGGEALYRATPGADLISPVDGSAAPVIARGEAVYLVYCAQCHGYDYSGQGTVGQSFQPLPTDLRSQAVQSKVEGELFKTVSYGVPDKRQPPLDATITIDDRWHVVAYVKSLGVRPQP